MLEPLQHAANPLRAQTDARQARDLLDAHTLPEVKPEDGAISLLFRPGQATLQLRVNLVQENTQTDALQLPADERADRLMRRISR